MWAKNHPEDAEKDIMQWAAEHPIKTNGMKFKEVFGFDPFALPIFSVNGGGNWLKEEYKWEQDDG